MKAYKRLSFSNRKALSKYLLKIQQKIEQKPKSFYK